jgi:hypothetical protein
VVTAAAVGVVVAAGEVGDVRAAVTVAVAGVAAAGGGDAALAAVLAAALTAHA